jgi:hypothetical protein
MGNCNHRKYIPHLVELVRTGVIDPRAILTKIEPLTGAIQAYEAFDKRRPGWIKVELTPRQGAATTGSAATAMPERAAAAPQYAGAKPGEGG